MKKILIILLLILTLSGCKKSSIDNDIKSISKDVQSEVKKDEKTENENSSNIQLPNLSEKDIEILNNLIKTCTASTAFEDAQFEYEFYYVEELKNINLRIIVIKPMQAIMDYYDVDVKGLIRTLRNGLVFDMVLSQLKDSDFSYKNFSELQVRFDDTKNDFYCFKYIDNE